MCTRGVYQLRRLNIWFCEFSGSSQGTRKFLKSDSFTKFQEENKQIEFNFIQRADRHPFIQSSYVNGYKKDVSLRNDLETEDILNKLYALRNSDGCKAMDHAGKKIYSSKPSIQGGWKQNMWDQYPLHEMERFDFIEAPVFPSIRVPILRPTEHERRQPDITRKYLKKKRNFIEKQPDITS